MLKRFYLNSRPALLVVSALLLVGPSQLHSSNAAQNNNNFSDTLRGWISKDIYFFKDRKHLPRLFIRRDPVRAFIYSDVPTAPEHVERAISHFADFSGVSFNITSTNPNLIAVITSPISEGNKPNQQLFRRLGLPDTAYDIVGETGGWSSGCGIYTFSGPDGQAALSLIFAESKLPAPKLEDCLIEGVIRAFGLRTSASNTIRSADGYLYYLTLAKMLAACDRSIDRSRDNLDQSAVEKNYIDCVAGFLTQ